ncbi:MAG: alpha/beta hydrolase-fold protein [Ignavibacteriaceae bacterium]|nr:alpha/beta hydrolase-fold protein [Ignavibacteriaceae bacterium]
MKKIFFTIIFILSSSTFSQSQFQQFISYVNLLGDPVAKQTAVDSFMTFARTQGIPFIEDSTANFIYLGNPNSVSVPGDFNGWSATSWPMTKLSQTNFWYRSENFELDARLDYKFVLNGSNWILDPENPHTCQGGFGPNSELSMPLYVQPWEINYNPNIAHGTVLTKVIFSTNVGTNYQLNIYLPPGYDSLASTTYPTVYFQDGSEYISLGKAVNVIDNLLDSSKIQPVIAVFIKPNNRNEEYAGSLRNQYRLFFVNELVPYIDANYKTKINPHQRLVLGDSFGGNISALISYNHPEVFGLCGLHSAAFWPNGYEAYNLIVNGPVKDIKWSSIWGTYESLYTNMRDFRDYLLSANYELDWLERPEGHSWGLWRATIDKMLMYFFPDNSSDVIAEDFTPKDFILYQNYPNPFNPRTIISWQSAVGSWQTLKVFDAIGNEVATLIDEYKPAGNYEVEFNVVQVSRPEISSGVYFYQLKIGVPETSSGQGTIQTKKMLLLK